jgi:transcriptional regulator with XRE-family HTH domain
MQQLKRRRGASGLTTRAMQQLKLRREASGLTTRALAKKANISLATLWRIETGAQSPSISTLERIAEALDCRVIDLINEDKPHIDAVVAELVQAVEARETTAEEAINTLESLGVLSRAQRQVTA